MISRLPSVLKLGRLFLLALLAAGWLFGVSAVAEVQKTIEPAAHQNAASEDPTHVADSAPITTGLRVFTCGHSFHAAFITPILQDMANGAGIEGHQIAGKSYIGGSRAIQHWDIPDDHNEAKKALNAGRVDVLTLAAMHKPDDGIEKFAELAFRKNPHVRVTLMEFWIPWDKFEWPYKGKPEDVNNNSATVEQLTKMHQPYFADYDQYVENLNKKLGKPVVFVVPMGQAVLALRGKIIAGQVPGIDKQSDLFTDKLGHPKPPLQALEGYCQFAVTYRRTPVGLPMPKVLSDAKNPLWGDKLNRMLQDIAWDAVTHHPLSGVPPTAK